MVPGLAFALDGEPIIESHPAALSRTVPLLGVVGAAALGIELSGSLGGTPFLAVKRPTRRRDTVPVRADRAATALAIPDFAERCARAWRERTPPDRPAHFRLEVAMPPKLAAAAAGKHGWVQASPAVLRLDAREWAATAEARGAAVQAAAHPCFDVSRDVDLSSEAALARQPPATVARVRRFALDFAAREDPPWWTA